MRQLVIDQIKYFLNFYGPPCHKSNRWNPVFTQIASLLKAKINQIDVNAQLFPWDKLDDEALISIFQNVIRRFYVQM